MATIQRMTAPISPVAGSSPADFRHPAGGGGFFAAARSIAFFGRAGGPGPSRGHAAVSTERRESVRSRAFTLLELLVVMAIIGVLVGLIVPAMASARRQALSASCGAHLHELATAFQMYAEDNAGLAMPLSFWSVDVVGSGPVVYWWGTNDSRGVDYRRGFLWPYLQSGLTGSSVFACPQQPWGSYRPQGSARTVTSTYGYNGYYLAPPSAPGWAAQIGHVPWLSLSKLKDPARVFVFADTLIDLGRSQPSNCALLDPPQLFSGGDWSDNSNPTTAFRHDGRTLAAHADGHVEGYAARKEWLTSRRFMIGSVGGENAPHYVPNWREWRSAEQ